MKKFVKLISIFAFVFVCLLSTKVLAFPPSSSSLYTGIDVSEWQGDIDWQEVKNAGIQVVYIRSSEGSGYIDADAIRNYN